MLEPPSVILTALLCFCWVAHIVGGVVKPRPSGLVWIRDLYGDAEAVDVDVWISPSQPAGLGFQYVRQDNESVKLYIAEGEGAFVVRLVTIFPKASKYAFDGGSKMFVPYCRLE